MKLSGDERALVGRWRLTIEGGNEESYELPCCLCLLPTKVISPSGSNTYSLYPPLPEDHLFAGVSSWELLENGTLELTWSNGFSYLSVRLYKGWSEVLTGYVEAIFDIELPEQFIVKRNRLKASFERIQP